MTAKRFSVRFFDAYPHMNTIHQPRRRRPSVPYAANVAPLGNLGKAAVAVAEVLGSENAEVLVTQDFNTRGTRASRPVKHRQDPRQSAVRNYTVVLSRKTMTLLMMLAG